MANITLAQQDAYLDHQKLGIQLDTLAALRNAPFHLPTLFPDSAIKKPEYEISHFDNMGHSSGCHRKQCRFHSYSQPSSSSSQDTLCSIGLQPGNLQSPGHNSRDIGKFANYSTQPANPQSSHK